jgi:hypothetical protein
MLRPYHTPVFGIARGAVILEDWKEIGMKTVHMIGMAGILAVGLAGCKPQESGKVLVNAGGQRITAGQFEEVVKAMTGDEKVADALLKTDAMKEQRNQFLESLGMQKALIQMAKDEGLERDSKTKVMLEQRMAQLYLQALIERRVSSAEPTEADLKGLYDSLVAERKAQGQDQGLPAFEEVKAQLPGVWKQRQQQAAGDAIFKEVRQKYPLTFADGYKPTPQPGQP